MPTPSAKITICSYLWQNFFGEKYLLYPVVPNWFTCIVIVIRCYKFHTPYIYYIKKKHIFLYITLHENIEMLVNIISQIPPNK